MRHWIAWALAGLLVLGFSTEAEAGKKSKKNKKQDTTEQTDREAGALELKETGVADIDTFFGKAKAPIDNLMAARGKVDKVNHDLVSALGLPQGTPFADALADLKTKAEGKVNMAISDKGVPELSAEDGVPENVQSAINDLNTAFGHAQGAVADLAALKEQFVELGTEGAELPGKIPDMGLKPLEIPKVTKTTKGNLDVLSEGPKEIEKLMASFTNLINDTKATFMAGEG